MDIFKEVRERADILQVCDVLGIKLNRNYKSICPFSSHKEKTASFSISPSKNIFYCFGCGEKGNSITLVQKILNISPLESAKYINDMLHLGLELNSHSSHFEINKYEQKRKIVEEFKKWENETFQLLCDYLHLLWVFEKLDWQSDLYVEAMHNKNYIEYVIDEVFIYGTNEDKVQFWKKEKRWIKEIESRVRAFGTIDD